MSRWRLCPEQRHAEVWRRPETKSETQLAVSPPAPPPAWGEIYYHLHKDLRVPTGAFSPVHRIIGKSVQEVCNAFFWGGVSYVEDLELGCCLSVMLMRGIFLTSLGAR